MPLCDNQRTKSARIRNVERADTSSDKYIMLLSLRMSANSKASNGRLNRALSRQNPAVMGHLQIVRFGPRKLPLAV
jgi:hypothetical protein